MRHLVLVLSFVLFVAACGVSSTSTSEERPGDDGGTFGEADVRDDGGDGSDDDIGGLDDGGDRTDADPGDATPGSDVPTDFGSAGPICGNGRVELGEACDDGNNFPGDGCSADCGSTEACGNGVLDAAEGCDDGNFLPGDGCDALCQLEDGCGNRVVEVGEQCDDGNRVDGDGCNADCQREISLVVDTDGDGISDFDEGSGFVDTDGDGITDDLDDDSDNDGVSDRQEGGDDDLLTEPVDTDRDARADFRDTDADGDGIPDAVETGGDFDGDGFGNYADRDSDGDYVGDVVEGTVDHDGDGAFDYLDTDSDDDTVLDSDELFADSDGDGTPNRLDQDSDDDGRPDSLEAGDDDPATYPIDTDGDGSPDLIDLDSDDDGLPDRDEHGCPASSDPIDDDSDNDGYPDMAEVLVGSDPCTPTPPVEFRTYTDFFFILPEDEPETAPLEFSSDIARADVHINIDSSGSMEGEIDNVRSRLRTTIVPDVAAEVDDVAFGFSDYRDCRGHAFRLRQRITTDISAVQTAINRLTDTSGGSEPSYSSLWHIGTGSPAGSCLDLPTFSAGAGLVPGVADGTIGGVGFRTDAFPVVIHATDESSEDNECGGCAKNRNDAVNALDAIDARMIGIVSGSAPRDELRDIARRTGAVVPVCAWDGRRPAGCGGGQCCTGVNGAGQGSEGGACPLVFEINSNGNGLADSMVTGIVALVNTTSFDVTTRLRRDEDMYLETGLDTRCFIDSIIPAEAVGSSACSTVAVPADLDPIDGVLDSFSNVTPGTALFFDVTAINDCVPQLDYPQAFFAFIDVIGDGVTVLDTQSVTIIVPASSEPVSTVP